MNRKFPRAAFVFALTLVATSPLLASSTFSVDPVHSSVSFEIRHFVSHVRGEFKSFSATIVKNDDDPAVSSVVFDIQAASIDTGNEKRDKHLRSSDFFDVEKFPEISFVSTKIEKSSGSTYQVTGNMTMHGVTKQITIPVEFAGEMSDGQGGIRAGFSSRFTIDRKDFGINWNRVIDNGGVMLGDDVDAEVELEAVRK